MGDIKQFLYAWLGKRKATPAYEFSQTGSKHKPRFKCEVSVSLMNGFKLYTVPRYLCVTGWDK